MSLAGIRGACDRELAYLRAHPRDLALISWFPALVMALTWAIFAQGVNVKLPLAFVDDYLLYLRGVPADVHTALILRSPNGSPNTGVEMALAKSTHEDLAAFAAYWLSAGSPLSRPGGASTA